jgi:hypothetical protein
MLSAKSITGESITAVIGAQRTTSAMRQMREMRQIPIMRDDNDQIYINDLWKSVAKPLPLDLDAF